MANHAYRVQSGFIILKRTAKQKSWNSVPWSLISLCRGTNKGTALEGLKARPFTAVAGTCPQPPQIPEQIAGRLERHTATAASWPRFGQAVSAIPAKLRGLANSRRDRYGDEKALSASKAGDQNVMHMEMQESPTGAVKYQPIFDF
jgi:hypothetical protein